MYHAVYDQGSRHDLRRRRERVARLGHLAQSAISARPGEHSSEGLAYEDGRRFSKVSTLAAGHDRLLVGVEAPGIFESRDGGATFSMLSTLAGEPGSEGWDDPANQPPGHLGISGIELHPDDPSRFYAIVQGVGLWETTDGGSDWTPRNRGLRADWPRDHEEVGFCVHKLARADDQRMFQQNHVGMHRTDDGGASWTEITEGLPTEFGFGAAVNPHDRDTFLVIPLDPGHGRTMPDGEARGLDHARRRLELAAVRQGASRRTAPISASCARRLTNAHRTTCPVTYFGTSTGQVFATCRRGLGARSEVASYLPPISSVHATVIE